MPTGSAEPPMADHDREPARVHLDFEGLFWRVALVSFVVAEVIIWRRLRRRARWGRRRPRLLVAWMVYQTPKLIVIALLIAAAVAVGSDLFVRYVLRPRLARWYDPAGGDEEFDSPIAFHLAPSERIELELPARRSSGRHWSEPGTLALTDRRAWFFPRGWDGEPWSIPLDRGCFLRVAPPPRFGWGFLRGLPDRIVLGHDYWGEATFAVAEPYRVIDWLSNHPKLGPLDPDFS
jgi:hypothetical protein